MPITQFLGRGKDDLDMTDPRSVGPELTPNSHTHAAGTMAHIHASLSNIYNAESRQCLKILRAFEETFLLSGW